MTRNRNNRHIIKRIIVRGTLVLDTPTCLGSGDAEGPTDLVLLRDTIRQKTQNTEGQELEGFHALLTGSSIAGALRNYLREYQGGYEADEQSDLFGGKRSDENGDQSPLIIDDAISSTLPVVELRDGVKIDGKTGTAADKAKYDLELLAAGTEFPLCFELLIDEENNESELIQSLALALQGLERGEIGIGMKKRRGFGRCHVKKWQVWQFNLRDSADRMAWLTLDRPWAEAYPPTTSESIAEALGVVLEQQDKRDRFSIHATFKLGSPLLIRSSEHSTERTPDVVHLKSQRGKEWQSVVSGTSLAGVLRHRAVRIVKTLTSNPGLNSQEAELIQELFGFVKEKKVQPEQNQTEAQAKPAKASRLTVHESVIKATTDLVQNRIAIDRFTGGAYHGALFSEQPIFGSNETTLKLELELRQPEGYEIGLLLLLLKDLWTGDLPVGGESSIGRGRLQGIDATITRHIPQQPEEWTISQGDGQLRVSEKDAAALKVFVEALVSYLGKATA